MASLLKKKIKGHNYYYYVETKRVNGKVKMAKQIYLGRAEKILQLCQQSPTSIAEVYHQAFGHVAALYLLCREFNLISLINRYVPQSCIDVGKYIVLAAINRCIAPKSKNKIRDWYSQTVLQDLLKIPKHAVTSQRFWDAMDTIEENDISRIQDSLWKEILSSYPASVEALLYDTTNFFTYIQDANKEELPFRGKNKAGKHQLNQVGLALVVTKLYSLPFLHKLYAGNLHDAELFPDVLTDLIQRYFRIAQHTGEITLIFDKGNNSLKNFSLLSEYDNIHFVGSLIPSDYPDLLRVRLSRYSEIRLRNGKSILAFRSRKKVFGIERLVIVSYNQSLAKKQKQKLEDNLQAAAGKLLSTHWGRVKKKKERVESILSHYHVKDLIKVTFHNKKASIEYNHKAIRQRKQKYGKNILFTDNLAWSEKEVVQAYRDKNGIEHSFRQMNDPRIVSFRPVYHWTDQKIQVHAFICVLALLLLRCLQMKLSQVNLGMSLPVLIEELDDIRSIIMLDLEGKIQHRISRMSAVQKKLFYTLGLDKVASELDIQFS